MIFRLGNSIAMNKVTLVLILVLAYIPLLAQEIPSRPVPLRFVNDFSSILSRNEKALLEQELVDFERETSTRVVIIAVTGFDGASLGYFVSKVAEEWEICQGGASKEALVVFKPKTLNEKAEVYIATGDKTGHLIPEAVANRIINYEMTPRFKQNDYYGGLAAGIKVIMELTRGEYTTEAYTNQVVNSEKKRNPCLFLIFLLLLASLPMLGGWKKGRCFTTGRNGLPFLSTISMIGTRRNSYSGLYANFSSGNGSFSGFGNSGIGGGGACGSW